VKNALLLGLLALSLVAPSFGCGKQGEGEPCDVLAGNDGADDCEDGLVCTPGSDLNEGGADICCPPSGSTNPSCVPGGLGTSSSTTATSSSSTSTTATSSASGGGSGGSGGSGGAGGSGGGTGGTGGT
jgi:hypothetical protein